MDQKSQCMDWLTISRRQYGIREIRETSILASTLTSYTALGNDFYSLSNCKLRIQLSAS